MNLFAPWRRALPFTAADGLPILLYHKVAHYRPGAPAKSHYISPALFRAHMSFLARGAYRTVGVGDIVRYLRGEGVGVERPIAITFDDGYDCVYANAFPVLQEFGFRAIILVLAGYVGGVNDWEPQRTTVVEPMLQAEHIAEMARGGMEFGSHGMRHHHLTKLADDDLRAEMTDSKKMLEDLSGREVRCIAYPYGDHNERVRAAAAEAGYVAGCTTARGVNRPGDQVLALKRINVRRHNYLPLFARKLRRAYGMAGPRA